MTFMILLHHSPNWMLYPSWRLHSRFGFFFFFFYLSIIVFLCSFFPWMILFGICLNISTNVFRDFSDSSRQVKSPGLLLVAAKKNRVEQFMICLLFSVLDLENKRLWSSFYFFHLFFHLLRNQTRHHFRMKLIELVSKISSELNWNLLKLFSQTIIQHNHMTVSILNLFFFSFFLVSSLQLATWVLLQPAPLNAEAIVVVESEASYVLHWSSDVVGYVWLQVAAWIGHKLITGFINHS